MGGYSARKAFGQRKRIVIERTEDQTVKQFNFLLYNAVKQILLGAEVIMEHCVRHTGILGNRGCARTGKTFGQKLSFSSLKYKSFSRFLSHKQFSLTILLAQK